MTDTSYVPGVCNIGPEETAMRRRVGWGGLSAAAVYLLLLIMLRPGVIWWAGLVVPSAVGAAGFIQAAMHFCAAFGLRHVFNFTPAVGSVAPVLARELWAADRRRALLILALSLASGIVITLAAMLLR